MPLWYQEKPWRWKAQMKMFRLLLPYKEDCTVVKCAGGLRKYRIMPFTLGVRKLSETVCLVLFSVFLSVGHSVSLCHFQCLSQSLCSCSLVVRWLSVILVVLVSVCLSVSVVLWWLVFVCGMVMCFCVLDVLCGVECVVVCEMGSVVCACVFARHKQKSSPHAVSASS